MPHSNGCNCGRDHDIPDFLIQCWNIGNQPFTRIEVCRKCIEDILLLLGPLPAVTYTPCPNTDDRCDGCGKTITDTFAILREINDGHNGQRLIKRICADCAQPITRFISAAHDASIDLEPLPALLSLTDIPQGGDGQCATSAEGW